MKDSQFWPIRTLYMNVLMITALMFNFSMTKNIDSSCSYDCFDFVILISFYKSIWFLIRQLKNVCKSLKDMYGYFSKNLAFGDHVLCTQFFMIDIYHHMLTILYCKKLLLKVQTSLHNISHVDSLIWNKSLINL